ncbi:Diguanylate cyclase DosC [compost metagenome]
MGFKGRIAAVSITFCFQTLFVLYDVYKYGRLDALVLAGYLLTLPTAYWAGFQFDRIKAESEKDPLTRLYNRRYVLDSYPRLTMRASKQLGKLFVLMIDCDNFKTINDKLTHEKGDLVLQRIAALLRAHTRSTDIVSRWGGDEFLVIGEYNGSEALTAMLKRIAGELESLSLEMGIPISATIGSAVYPDDHHHINELIKIADREMYSYKPRTKEEDAFLAYDLTRQL